MDDDKRQDELRRESLSAELGAYLESGQLKEDFRSLSSERRLGMFYKLAGFVLPKLKSVNMTSSSRRRSRSADPQDLLLTLFPEMEDDCDEEKENGPDS